MLQAAKGYLKTQLRLFRSSINSRHNFKMVKGGNLTLADVNRAFHDEFGNTITIHWNDVAGVCYVWKKTAEELASEIEKACEQQSLVVL